MTALENEEAMNQHQLVPFYQPIIGADQKSIVGYEILGRWKNGEIFESLGPFFHSSKIPEQQKGYVDAVIRSKALQYIREIGNTESSYFFNLNLQLISPKADNDFYCSLYQVLETGINPEQIVLEITENTFLEGNQKMKERLKKYRYLGCKIAIDDVGKGSSNLERVAHLSPDIIKVDLSLVQKSSTERSYRDVLHALSILSQKLGASLLFEGIESLDNVKNAWKNGAQYYQGYLFAKPQSTFINAIDKNISLSDHLEQMIQKEVLKLNRHYSFEDQLNQHLQTALNEISFCSNFNEYVQQFIPYLPKACFRLYLCDKHGYQKSANFFMSNDTWNIQQEFTNKNWSYRPYFLRNIVHMQVNQKGILSEGYCDIESQERTYTFSYPVHHELYLFIDIK